MVRTGGQPLASLPGLSVSHRTALRLQRSPVLKHRPKLESASISSIGKGGARASWEGGRTAWFSPNPSSPSLSVQDLALKPSLYPPSLQSPQPTPHHKPRRRPQPLTSSFCRMRLFYSKNSEGS